MKLFRSIRDNSLVAAAAVLLCACGTQQAGEGVGATSTPPENAPSAEPGVEPTGQPEKPQQPGGGAPSIPVPTLPIGGNGPEPRLHQCAHVSWIGSEIPKNMSVRVKGVQFGSS